MRTVTRSIIIALFVSILASMGGCFPSENKLPDILITSPQMGDEIFIGDDVNINTTIFDEDGFIQEVTISIDSLELLKTTVEPFKTTWETAGWSAGKYNIYVRATDDEGEDMIVSIHVFLIEK